MWNKRPVRKHLTLYSDTHATKRQKYRNLNLKVSENYYHQSMTIFWKQTLKCSINFNGESLMHWQLTGICFLSEDSHFCITSVLIHRRGHSNPGSLLCIHGWKSWQAISKRTCHAGKLGLVKNVLNCWQIKFYSNFC